MSKSLKAILDTVNDEAGWDRASNYIASQDPNIRTLVAIAQRSALVLRDLHLTELVRQAVIPLSEAVVDLSLDPQGRISLVDLPDDFYAYTNDTSYQDGRIDPAQLPTPAPTWAYLISRSGPQSLRVRERLLQGKLAVFSPDATQNINFEYISKNPIDIVSNTPQPSPNPRTSDQFTADVDTWQLDDTLIEYEIIWRYQKVKGLGDWESSYQEAQRYQNELRARNSGATTIYPPDSWPYPAEPYTNLWVDN